MGMLKYIREIKRQFRDVYHFVPTGDCHGELIFGAIPDGDYPMTIDSRVDNIQIVNGFIRCCNFKEAAA